MFIENMTKKKRFEVELADNMLLQAKGLSFSKSAMDDNKP